MKIAGWQKVSLIDYSGKSSTIVFTPGCNYRCGYCYNPELVRDASGKEYDEEEIFQYLDSRKGKINAVVICGGEPTVQEGLVSFCRRAKEKELAVKLDTNGSNFQVLQDLLRDGLVDYIAMDVKAPPYLYEKATRKESNLRNIERGIAIASQFPGYEFRTTVIPIKRRNGQADYMTIGEVCDIAKWIISTTDDDSHKYYLQPFVPGKKGLLDPDFEKIQETPIRLLEIMKREVRKYLPNCEIRGQ